MITYLNFSSLLCVLYTFMLRCVSFTQQPISSVTTSPSKINDRILEQLYFELLIDIRAFMNQAHICIISNDP